MAKEIGISKIGFTTADDFAYLENPFDLVSKKGRTTGFEHKNIEERIYPKLTLNQLKPSFPLQLPIRISCHNNPKNRI